MLSVAFLFVFAPAFARSPPDSQLPPENEACVNDGKFWCSGSSRCIDSILVCNGENNCGDNADEGNCKDRCSQEALVACAYPTSVDKIKFATKREDLDELCPNLHSGLRCIDNYTRICFQPDQRSHFNRLYAGTSMVIQEICQPGHYQEEFLRHAPCMNRITAEYEACVHRYQSQLHNLTQEVQEEQEGTEGLRKLCGNLHDLLKCSKRIVKQTCGEETAQFAAGFLDRMADSLIRRHCTENEDQVSSSSRATSFLLIVLFGSVLTLIYS